VESDELAELGDERVLRSLQDSGDIIHAERIERGDDRQPPDDLGDQPEVFEVFWLHLAQQSIACRLSVFSQLKPESTPPEPPGDDVFKTHERAAAMNSTLLVSKGMPGCIGCFKPPRGGTVAIVPSSIFKSAFWTPTRMSFPTVSLIRSLSISSM
jgi:hypothetical protein